MDVTQRYELLRRSLGERLDSLNPDLLLRWLDELAEDCCFYGVPDVVGSFLELRDYQAYEHADWDTEDPQSRPGLSEWDELVDYWQDSASGAGLDLRLKVEGDEVVIIDDDTKVEIIRSRLPDWLLGVEQLIRFLSQAYQRPLFASELRDFLVSLWLPAFA